MKYIIIITLLLFSSCYYNSAEYKAEKMSRIEHYKNDYGDQYFAVERLNHDLFRGSTWIESKRFKSKDSAAWYRNEIMQKDIIRLKSEYKVQ